MNWKIILALLLLLGVMQGVSASTYTNFTVYWSVASSYDHSIAFNANCAAGTAYFVENDAVVDGNQWKVLPYDDSSKSNLCQDNTAAYFVVTITGTANAELDINATAGTGEDVNMKVYLANTTIYCGDSNCNGWEETCSVTDGAVTSTTCLQLDTSDKEFGAINTGASASYCMCADFNATGTPVTVGNHEETVGVTSRVAD